MATDGDVLKDKTYLVLKKELPKWQGVSTTNPLEEKGVYGLYEKLASTDIAPGLDVWLSDVNEYKKSQETDTKLSTIVQKEPVTGHAYEDVDAERLKQIFRLE
eukprot:Clim_evm21s238 gene=Clim_evmTU21s238